MNKPHLSSHEPYRVLHYTTHNDGPENAVEVTGTQELYPFSCHTIPMIPGCSGGQNSVTIPGNAVEIPGIQWRSEFSDNPRECRGEPKHVVTTPGMRWKFPGCSGSKNAVAIPGMSDFIRSVSNPLFQGFPTPPEDY